MKILFICATSIELKIVKENIKQLKIKENISFEFLCLWIWNYQAIATLSSFDNIDGMNFIVNIWVCGYKFNYVPFFQVWKIRSSTLNQELIPPIFLRFGDLMSIYCSDLPVYDSSKLQTFYDSIDFVDMESFGIEFVLQKYQIPRIYIKVPVDQIWEETKNFDFDKAKKLLNANIDYLSLVNKIKTYLDRGL